MTKMRYAIEMLPESAIREFLSVCGDDFIPPLGDIVRIDEYSGKLASLATHFCAFDGERLVGAFFCYCNDFDTMSAFLSAFCFLGDYRGKGYGKRLSEFAEAEIARMGFRSISLKVGVCNARSVALYKNIGFIVEKEENGWIVMKKDL